MQKAAWQHCLDWAVRAFKITASVAEDNTQIYTHMCYSEFNDILPAIAAMDVIPAERLWINPDCSLKTRGWEETRHALQNMVTGAKRMGLQLMATYTTT